MAEDMIPEIDSMEPDIEDLAERLERVEYEIGDGASALVKIKVLEREISLIWEDIRALRNAINARK